MIKTLGARFDALSQRERVLIALTVLVFVVVLLFLLLIEPWQKQQQRLSSQVLQTQQLINARQTELSALTAAVSKDPSAAVKTEVAQLTQQDQQLNDELRERSSRLVAPQQMSQMLAAVLQKQEGVALQKLTSLPVEPLALGQSEVTEDAPQESTIHLYKHAFELQVQGSYAAIYAYLQQLEQLSGAFFWEGLEYQVTDHPTAEVKLRVYTLSAEEGWLGG